MAQVLPYPASPQYAQQGYPQMQYAPGGYPQQQQPQLPGVYPQQPMPQPMMQPMMQPGLQYAYPQQGPYLPGTVTPGYQQPQPAPVMAAAPPVQVVVVNNSSVEKAIGNPMSAIIVFVIGWFFCPVWCAGWAFIGKRHGTTARIFGFLSVGCATVNVLIIAITLGVIFGAESTAYSYYDYYYYEKYD